MNPLVSIIIPVYNVEAYLNECVESIIKQTYRNIEIILVNDGSTDNSGNICEDFSKKDERIKVIHKKNGGLSDARNVGFQNSKGEYISYVDSDDIVSDVFIESMLKNIIKCNADIAALKKGSDFWDGDVLPELDHTIVIGETVTANNALEKMLYMQIATGAPFKVYRREVIDNIKFPYGYLYEDVATTYKTFLNSNRITIIDSMLYAYRKRKNSIIRGEFNKDKMICIKIADQLIKDITEYDPSLRKASVARAFSMVYSVFLQVPKEDSKDRILLWDWIKKYRLEILLNPNKLLRIKNRNGALATFFGMNIAYDLGKKFGQKNSMG